MKRKSTWLSAFFTLAGWMLVLALAALIVIAAGCAEDRKPKPLFTLEPGQSATVSGEVTVEIENVPARTPGEWLRDPLTGPDTGLVIFIRCPDSVRVGELYNRPAINP